MKTCRCGYSGEGDHPCHAEGYTCGKSAKQRFYNPRPVALSGFQMKLQVEETWACDEHWESFQKQLKKVQENARNIRAQVSEKEEK